MSHPDAAVAWRLFQLIWIPVGAMCVVLIAGAVLTGFSIEPVGLIITCGYVGVYAGFAIGNALAPSRRDPQVVFSLGATAQIVLVTAVMTPLTYLAASLNFPMQDANLLAADRALGLDSRAYGDFVKLSPVLASWLTAGYNMIRWPIFAIPIILCAARRYSRLQEYTLAFLLALMVTTAISTFVPAIGHYQELSHDLPLVRSGAIRSLDFFALDGIVTFPSFHAASALLYGWALWPVRWFRPVAVIANVAMLAATPINGGHYFVDLGAGLVLAALAIAAARRVSDVVRAHLVLTFCRSPDVLASAAAIASD